jgi:hypothetical protein
VLLVEAYIGPHQVTYWLSGCSMLLHIKMHQHFYHRIRIGDVCSTEDVLDFPSEFGFLPFDDELWFHDDEGEARQGTKKINKQYVSSLILYLTRQIKCVTPILMYQPSPN